MAVLPSGGRATKATARQGELEHVRFDIGQIDRGVHEELVLAVESLRSGVAEELRQEVYAMRRALEAAEERRLVVDPPPPRGRINLEIPLLSLDQALAVAEALRQEAHRMASNRAAG